MASERIIASGLQTSARRARRRPLESATGRPPRPRNALLAVLLGTTCFAPAAHAADRFWIGSGSFNTPGNWTGGVTPGANDRAIFQEDNGGSTSDVTADVDVGGVVFRAGGNPATTLSLTTGDLAITQTGVVNEDTRTLQFLNVGDGRTLTFDNGTRAGDAILISVAEGGVVGFRGAGPAGQPPSGADLQLDGTLVVSTADAAVTFDDANGAGSIRFDAPGSVDVRAGTLSGDITGDAGQLIVRRRGSFTFTGDSASEGVSATVGSGAVFTIGDGGSSGSFAGDIETAGALVFDRTDSRTYAGSLTGTTATGFVTVRGAGGELRLTGDNSGFTQSYLVENGATLALDTATGALADNRISLGAGSTFRFDAPRDYGFGGVFSGGADATLEISGDATTVTLTGDSSGFDGDINVGFNSGLRIGNGGATGDVQSDIRLGDGAFLTFDRGNAFTYGGSISGGSFFTKDGGGVTTLTGVSDFQGFAFVNEGTLRLANGGTLGEHGLSVAAGATFDLNGQDQTLNRLGGAGEVALGAGTLTLDVGAIFSQFNGVISGTGGITKLGSFSTQELGGQNTYTGDTNVAEGVLRLVNNGNLSAQTALTIGETGTFDLNGRNQTVASLSGAGEVLLGAGRLIVNQVGATTYSGEISGSGGLTKAGAGTLTLTDATAYSGATIVNRGTLRLTDDASLVDEAAVAVAAGATLDIRTSGNERIGDLSGGGLVRLFNEGLTAGTAGSSVFGGVLAETGSFTKVGAGTLTFTGANRYLGATTVSEGTLRLGAGGALSSQTSLAVAGSAAFDLNGRTQTVQDFSGEGSVTLGAGQLTAGAAADTSFDGVISGAGGGLTKAGGGALTLSAANTYTGTTIVSGGTLNVTGSLVSDATIESGATLRGSGSVADVTVGTGGALSPDGVLRLRATALSNGSVTFDQGSDFRIRTTGVQNDLLLADGFAELSGGTVRVQANGGYNASTTYIILNAQDGILSRFDGVTTDLAFIDPTLTYDRNNVFLTFDSANFVTPEQSNAQNSVGEALTVAAAQDPGGAGGEILDRLDDLNAEQGAAALDALSGEGSAGSQEAAFFLGDAFHGAMIDQTADWRIAKSQPVVIAPVTAYAAEPARPAAFAGLISKDPPAAATERTWRSWFSGFGGKRDIDGTRGAADVDVRGGGGAGGVDYQINPNLLVGFSLGAGTASFSVNERDTSGDVDGAHAGLYAAATAGPAYFAASFSYSRFDNDTKRRIVGVGGAETAKGDFDSEQLGARVELGWRKQFERFALTPYASLQYLDTFQEAYKEKSRAAAGAPGILGLEFGDRTSRSVPLTIGLQADAEVDLGDGAVWRPYGSIAWQHDLSPDRGVNAALLSLPNNPFVVDAARAGQDIVRLKGGSRFSLDETRALFFDADASLSSSYTAYSVKGGFNMLFGDRKAAAPVVAGAETPAAPAWTSTANLEAKFSTFEGTRGFPAAVSVGERGRGYQFYDAITVATSGVVGSDLKVELQGRGGYVYSKQTTDGASGSVSTTTDSVLSGTVTYSGLAGYAPFLSLNLNLPTGRTVLKGSDAFARLDSDFVDLATFGEGFNIGPTLGVNVFLSPEWTATLSAGYTHRGAYDREAPVAPDGSQGTQRLAPGSSGSLSAGLTYNKDTLFANANLTVSHDSATFLNNAPSFKPGDRLVVSGVAQKSWSDASRTALSGFATLGRKNKVLDPNLVVLSPEAANSNNTVFRLQLDHTFVKGQWEFGPTGSYTRRFENGFSPTTFSFVPAKEKVSLGAAAKYTFDQAFSVNAKLERFWSREKAQPDKIFLGAPLVGTGTPRLSHHGWNGMLAGAYNF